MAVDSIVPRMNGSSPYWLWVGFHVFPTIQENPSVEKAGFAWMTRETTNQTASAAEQQGDDAEDPPVAPVGQRPPAPPVGCGDGAGQATARR